MQPESGKATCPASVSYAASFSEALLRPGLETPAIVSGSHGQSAHQRYNVYRNNVTVSLIDALAATFPAVQRITGTEFFRAMARFHVRETPPVSPLLFEYGHDFPAFIDDYEHAQNMPWLSDVARIERAWLDSYHAADAPCVTAADLASAPADRLQDVVFTAHPATRIVRSQYAALTIFVANRYAEPLEEIDASCSEDALLSRGSEDVEARHLPAGGAIFLSALIDGAALGEAAARAADAAPDFDLAFNIRTMLEAGAFTAVRWETIHD